MVTNQTTDAAQIQLVVTQTVQHHWVTFLIEGVVLVVLGLLAILVPHLASLAATLIFGSILLIGGGVGLVATIRARYLPGFWWSLLSAIVGIAAGALLLGWPLQGMFSLTVVLIAFLLAEGVASILYALDHRKGVTGRWGWMLASGILDLALGAILLFGLPGTSVWALGLIVGINLSFGGWALIAIALHAHSEAAQTGPPSDRASHTPS